MIATAATCVIAAIGTGILIRTLNEEKTRKALRITAEMLTDAFVRDNVRARQQFGGKPVIISGSVSGMDRGLFGDGNVYLFGAHGIEIECNVNGHFGSALNSHRVRILGTCQILSFGVPFVDNCEVLDH